MRSLQAAEAGLFDSMTLVMQPAASLLEQDLAVIDELRTSSAGVR